MTNTAAPPLVIKNYFEMELLFRCARTEIKPSSRSEIDSLLQSDIDWDALIELADWHGVSPLLSQTFQKLNASHIPNTTLSYLRRDAHSNLAHNLLLSKELIHTLDLFEKHNITAACFKGLVLAEMAYEDINLRQIGDLDFWIPEKDFQSATDLLQSLDYSLTVKVPWEEHLTRHDSLGTYSIDLHRNIVPQHLSGVFSTQELESYITTFSFQNRSVPTFLPEFQLLILCLNGTKECWRKLSRICDVAEFIGTQTTLDWNKVIVHAQKRGYQRLIQLGLNLTHSLLDTTLPETVWEWVCSDMAVQGQTMQIKQKLLSQADQEVGEVEKTLFHVRTRERLQDKFKSFIGLISHSGWMTPTQNDRSVINLPKGLSFLYFLIRPLRILNKYSRTLLTFARSKE